MARPRSRSPRHQQNVCAAAIAANELDVEPEHLAGDQHDVGLRAAGLRAAEDGRASRLLQVFQAGDARVRADQEAERIVIVLRGGAEPGETIWLELGGGVSQQRLQRIVAHHHADGEAVARHRRIHGVGHHHAAGAGLVLDHDIGLARDVSSHVGQQASILVVAAALRRAHHEVDGLAFVEVLRGGGMRRRRHDGCKGEQADGTRQHVGLRV